MALLILAGLSHVFGGWLAVTWPRVVLEGTTRLSCTQLPWACFPMARQSSQTWQGSEARTQAHAYRGFSLGSLRLRLKIGTLSFSLHSVGPSLKVSSDSGRGKTEFYLFMKTAIKSHCKKHRYMAPEEVGTFL